jgi:ornithine cyclodeaminase/alanine dehydrogenase-like protein (mu-crystallin family)
MPLFLSNADQEQTITPADAIEAFENGVRQFARHDAIRRPRIDCFMPAAQPGEFFCFSSMEGTIRSPGYHALRIKPDIVSWPVVNGSRRRVSYCSRPGLYGGLVFLFDLRNAELLAIMNDGFVQHVRVAASAALGIRYLSSPQSRVLGMIGSGGMARWFALSTAVVRPIERVQVYSPNRAHLHGYCNEMQAKLSCEIVAVDSPREAADEADILSLCTSSIQPVVPAESIRPGMHITNVTPHELSPEAYCKIEVVGLLVHRTPMDVGGLVDDDFGFLTDVMSYAGGQPEERRDIPVGSQNVNRYPNARIVDCCDWNTGEPYERERPTEITTLFNSSNGIVEGNGGGSSGMQGIQFATIAGRIYERALELGLGTNLPLEMFLQDIPT